MKQLPVGVDDFKKLSESDFYYVDKSLLIKELLDKHGEVNVFTRPRRFGKTLALSMLKYYFEKEIDEDGQIQDNSALFAGLKISEAGEKYTNHMGQYPVIFMSLKSAKQPEYELAYHCIQNEIAKEFERHLYVLQGDKLSDAQKEQFLRFAERRAEKAEYLTALEFLTRMLTKYSGKKVIVLLDEYDVPLENAWFRGFYGQMADFIRSLFESVLKTNKNLEFAVITGCLRIAKESIFTGLNNLEIVSILNRAYSEYFGFTGAETVKMLEDFQITEKKDEMKRWYDGYKFGQISVYNPWSVINYVKTAMIDRAAWPKAYWANTSSNDIVRKLIERADSGVRQELEKLIAGGTIEKPVHEDITYEDIFNTQDNLWNFLFFTGYLKKTGERFENRTLYLTLKIPNEEVLSIYQNTVMEWYDRRIRQKDFTAFYRAILNRDVKTMERELSMNLMETVSFYDYKEDYYHGYTAGLLKFMEGYIVKSNRESGLGRSDILVLSAPYDGVAVIIETKVADTFAELEDAAKKALAQIEEKQYDAELKLEGYHTFFKYGFAFYKKLCRVMTE